MGNLIGYCGIDCEKCNARRATVRDDDLLREKTADLWSEVNGVEISPEMINCKGCKAAGARYKYCEMCEIRQCARESAVDSCKDCMEKSHCDKYKAFKKNQREYRRKTRTKKDKQMMWLYLASLVGVLAVLFFFFVVVRKAIAFLLLSATIIVFGNADRLRKERDQ